LFEAAARFGRTSPLGTPREVAERMYREGYPDDVVDSVVAGLLDEWTGYNSIQEARKRGDATARRVSAVFSGGGPLQKYMQDLFPHWREREEGRKARERELRFPAMPFEKIMEVERLETELKSTGSRDADLRAALANVITPEELTDYMRFNSSAAKELQREMSSIQIDEPTYDRLLAVASSRNEGPGRGTSISDYRGILSDKQFVQLISKNGASTSMPAQADAIYREAGLTDTQRTDLFLKTDDFSREQDRSRRKEAAKAALDQIRAALAGAPESAQRFEASALARSLEAAALK
jgi:hypothetical protein